MNLKRVLEPEVMDSQEEARDYDQMDHAEVNQAFVADLLAFARQHDIEGLNDVLDLGTGTALIPIELCQQTDNCRVMAVDLAASMLDLARYHVEAHGLIERITLAQVDAKQMGFDDGMFDVVISNSIVHHIPEPMVCLRELVRVVCEGGIVFVRDLARPCDLEALEKLVEMYAGKESGHAQQMFRESLHAALTVDEMSQLVNELGFDANSVQMTSDRHWTWTAVKS